MLARKHAQSMPKPRSRTSKAPERIVIVGGGAAGFAAAQRLRLEQYEGSIVMLSDDDAPPVDRPNLSKDYLVGEAAANWVPLPPDSFYPKNGIDLHRNANVTGIDARSRNVTLAHGSNFISHSIAEHYFRGKLPT